MPIAIRNDKLDLSSEKKTEELAQKFVKRLKPGNTIFFYGEMGVGKTTFIRYLINGFQKINNFQLKFNEKLTEVTSPTFNIMNEYEISDFTIKHYDLYRMKSATELNDLNLFDVSGTKSLNNCKNAPHSGSAGSQTAPGTRLPALRARLLASQGGHTFTADKPVPPFG